MFASPTEERNSCIKLPTVEAEMVTLEDVEVVGKRSSTDSREREIGHSVTTPRIFLDSERRGALGRYR